MNKTQIKRMKAINELLHEISKYDRHFFTGERFALNKKGNLRYICNGEEVMPRPSKSRGYWHGSTLNRLLEKMRIYILTGQKSNSLNARHWGYSDENVETLQKFAKEVGFLLKEDESDEILLKACKKLNVEPNEIFNIQPMTGRFVFLNNDKKYGSGLFYLWEDEDRVESCNITIPDLFKGIKQGKMKVQKLLKYKFDPTKKDDLFSYMVENFHFENAVSKVLLKNIIDTVAKVENSGDLLFLLFDAIGITEEELLHHGLIRINIINRD